MVRKQLVSITAIAFVAFMASMLVPEASAQRYKDTLYHLSPQDRSQRTLYTVENQFPEVGQYELGGQVLFGEFDDAGFGVNPRSQDTKVAAFMPQIRYAPFEDSFVYIKGHSALADPSRSSGNLNLGAEIGGAVKVHEHICDHPYIIPHASLGIRTGDEDDFRFLGESFVKFGVTFGDVIWSRWHWLGDISYDLRTETEDRILVSASTIYELTERLGFIAELAWSDETDDDEERWDDEEFDFHVGGYWDFNEDVRFSALFGRGYQGLDNFGLFQMMYQIPKANREATSKIDSYLGRQSAPPPEAPQISSPVLEATEQPVYYDQGASFGGGTYYNGGNQGVGIAPGANNSLPLINEQYIEYIR